MLQPLLLLCFAADLTPANIAQLKPAWTFNTKAKAPNSHAAQIAAFEATPALAEGHLLVITPFNQLVALDPETGQKRWEYDPSIATDRNYSEATARGVAVSRGKVYFGTLDARLIAVRASDGVKLWQASLDPGVRDGNYQITSAPVVAGRNIIVGSAIGDNSRAVMERGVVRAYDEETGKLKWAWDPTPPGKTGAANAWAPMSVDSERDMVLIPTGSASPDFFGGLRPGNNEFANSVVALRASTGKLIWSFQVVHHDLWDYDVASRPVLFEKDGNPAVGVLTKVGHYFLLDRLTGKPLLPVVDKPVPKSDVVGENASPTQPFPLSGTFTNQKFVPRPGWCEDRFKQLRYDGLFTPPSLGGTLVFPGNVGGANWGSGAYDASRHLIYAAANQLATTVRLIPRKAYDAKGHGDTGERVGLEYGAQAGSEFGMVRQTFLGPDGRPCNQPPWGALVAIEADTGKLRWESPIGVSLGGPLVTGGVVFFGGTAFESKLRAFSADDGKKVWEYDLPSSAHSVPATYMWKDRRYVVVSAGGHGKIDGSKVGDHVIAFRLEP